MLRIRSLTASTLVLGLSVLAACGGGEASQQQASSGEAVAGETTTSSAMASGQQEAQMPEGVTAEMVAQGKDIYAGAGLCYVCHGADGSGMPGLGADLTDDEWLHGDGSFESIIETVMNGVDAAKSTAGTPMAAKGGSGITDEQVKAVAAYVFTLRG
jgi:mono/diheme cytochrome c family protein